MQTVIFGRQVVRAYLAEELAMNAMIFGINVLMMEGQGSTTKRLGNCQTHTSAAARHRQQHIDGYD